MKKVTTMLFLFCCIQTSLNAADHSAELKVLDRAIEKRDEYLQDRLSAIEQLKGQSSDTLPWTDRYDLWERIAGQYKSMVCDSLLFYTYKMVDLAREHDDMGRLVHAQILLAQTQNKSGLYEEASFTLKSIRRSNIPEHLLDTYYWTCCSLYRSMAYITRDTRIAGDEFIPQARMFRDSLKMVLTPSSDCYYDIMVDNLTHDGYYLDVVSLSKSELEGKDRAHPEYGKIWYYIAAAKGFLGDDDGQISAYIESAISDIVCATKDHASLHKVAQYLFVHGDVNRSAKYMQVCMDDAMFFNANLRGLQIGQTLPVVLEAYNRRIARQMMILYILVAITVVSLIACLCFLMKSVRQRRQLSLVKKKLEEANDNLISLNAKLQESDYIKESYVAHFIQKNSDYISKTHNLLLQLNKSLRKGKINDALDLISSSLTDDDDVSSFHDAFDKAFLSIFPDFVERFNELLKEEFKYDLNKFKGNDCCLSSELRVYAMIRLGFNDSATLAEMLRYSVNSIYNIRSKAKSKSITPKADFDDMVKRIGVV